MRRRFAPAAVSAAVVLSSLTGCTALGVGGGPGPSATTSAVPFSSKPVPLLSGVATPKPKTSAPALQTTGSAWVPILTSLSGYGQWLIAHPDPALIGNIAAPGCAMSDVLGLQLSALLDENAYVKTSPVAITNVVGPSPAIGSPVLVTATASRAAEPVLSRAKGTVITTYDAVPPTKLVITLDKGADSRWRLCTVQSLYDSGDSSDPSVPLL
jgi:hypothetical protein